jgi:hypothetical protein
MRSTVAVLAVFVVAVVVVLGAPTPLAVDGPAPALHAHAVLHVSGSHAAASHVNTTHHAGALLPVVLPIRLP